MLNWLVLYVESNKRTSGCCLNMSRVIRWRKRRDVSVIGGVPEGNRRDHNIVRVSSFASKELSWHKRSCIVCLRVRRKLKLALLKRAQLVLYMLSDVTDLAVDCITDLPTMNCIHYNLYPVTLH